MRSRIVASLALYLFVLLFLNVNPGAAEKGVSTQEGSLPALISEYHGTETTVFLSGRSSDEGGIKEVIPTK